MTLTKKMDDESDRSSNASSDESDGRGGVGKGKYNAEESRKMDMEHRMTMFKQHMLLRMKGLMTEEEK